jgi:hypothetical protein
MVDRKLFFVPSPKINTFQVPKIEKITCSCPQVSLENKVNQAHNVWTNFSNINTTCHILSKVKTIKICITVVVVIIVIIIIIIIIIIIY